MKLLGNNMIDGMGETASPPYALPYETPEAVSTIPPDFPEPYRDTGITPLHRQAPRPVGPMDELSQPRHLIPPAPGPRYIQGAVGRVVPATHAPNYIEPMISDHALIRILVAKNTYLALNKRGLPTVAMRRRMLDANTQRQVENDVLLQTLTDVSAVASGNFSALNGGNVWQREAIRNKLVDAAELRNIMARVVGIQSWTEKG